MLCGVWYLTSIFTNMSSKAILTALPRPITLTTVQFAFVSGWCLVLAMLARKYPRLNVAFSEIRHSVAV
jgi:solute carrier family 35 protein E1